MSIRRWLYIFAMLLPLMAGGPVAAQDAPPSDRPREIHLDTRILRYQYRKGAAPEVDTVATQSFKTLDNMTAAMSVDGVYSMEIVPRLAGNDLTLTGKLSMPPVKGATVITASNARRAIAGTKIRVTGLTDTEDKAIQETVRRGDLPADGAFLVYYLEVCARIVPL